MKTFKQIIKDFIDGATRGIEGTTEHKHAKLAIRDDILLWITADTTYMVAIRLSKKVIVKSISYSTLNNVDMGYLNKRAKATKICVVRLNLPAIKNTDFDTKYKDLEKAVKEYIDDSLLNEFEDCMIEPMENKQGLGAYVKKLKKERQAGIHKDFLQNSVRILQIIEQDQTLRKSQLSNENYMDFIGITRKTREVLEKLNSYIQVLITLPEIISSPNENTPRPEEHPGGNDSGLSTSTAPTKTGTHAEDNA